MLGLLQLTHCARCACACLLCMQGMREAGIAISTDDHGTGLQHHLTASPSACRVTQLPPHLRAVSRQRNITFVPRHLRPTQEPSEEPSEARTTVALAPHLPQPAHHSPEAQQHVRRTTLLKPSTPRRPPFPPFPPFPEPPVQRSWLMAGTPPASGSWLVHPLTWTREESALLSSPRPLLASAPAVHQKLPLPRPPSVQQLQPQCPGQHGGRTTLLWQRLLASSLFCHSGMLAMHPLCSSCDSQKVTWPAGASSMLNRP